MERNGLLKSLEEDTSFVLLKASNYEAAFSLAADRPLDLMLLDDDNKSSWRELATKAREIDAHLPILIFRNGEPETGKWEPIVDDYLRMPVSPAELMHHVSRALKSRQLGRQVDHLTRENQQLYQLAITDGLTRLVNRRHFIERLQAEFARARRFNGKIGVVISDIDHFKRVNDTYGHLVGDRILREVSAILNSQIRSIDMAARYGGEEFVLLLPETELQGVMIVAEKVRSAVEAFDFTPSDPDEMPGPAHITISLGAAAYPETEAATHEELLEKADHALYRAKEGGRNRVEATGS